MYINQILFKKQHMHKYITGESLGSSLCGLCVKILSILAQEKVLLSSVELTPYAAHTGMLI